MPEPVFMKSIVYIMASDVSQMGQVAKASGSFGSHVGVVEELQLQLTKMFIVQDIYNSKIMKNLINRLCLPE
jgi:hypothetical protein